MTTPSLTGGDSVGAEFFLQTTADAATCKAALGRACLANALVGSGTVASRVTASVLSSLKSRASLFPFLLLLAWAGWLTRDFRARRGGRHWVCADGGCGRCELTSPSFRSR